MPKLKNPNWEEFCRRYTSEEMFGHGTNSYIKAYSKKPKTKSDYLSIGAHASRLLTNEPVQKRINELLDKAGFNDENVDKQHLFLINQHVDLKSKMAAIKEYNTLRKRTSNNTNPQLTVNLTYESFTLNQTNARFGLGRTFSEVQGGLPVLPEEASGDQDEAIGPTTVHPEPGADATGKETGPTGERRKTYSSICP